MTQSQRVKLDRTTRNRLLDKLETFSRSELIDTADYLGILINNKPNKQEIIELIRKALL